MRILDLESGRQPGASANLQFSAGKELGAISACIGRMRARVPNPGVKSLFDLNHVRTKFSSNDPMAGAVPIASNYNTGTYTVTTTTVDHFLGAA